MSRISFSPSVDEILSVEQDLAARLDAARRADQAQDRQRGHRLAAARLADEPDRLARADLEADAVDRAGDAVLGVEVRAEIANASSGSAILPVRFRRQPIESMRRRIVAAVKLPWIEDVAQGVAEHVEGEHGDDDRDAGKERDPPVAGEELHAVEKDRSPARRRLARADAEIRKPGLERDDVADGERRRDDTGAATFGSTWRSRIRASSAPSARAASTYSRSSRRERLRRARAATRRTSRSRRAAAMRPRQRHRVPEREDRR